MFLNFSDVERVTIFKLFLRVKDLTSSENQTNLFKSLFMSYIIIKQKSETEQ